MKLRLMSGVVKLRHLRRSRFFSVMKRSAGQKQRAIWQAVHAAAVHLCGWVGG